MTSSPVIILTGASRGLGLSVLKILLSRYNARVSTLSRSYPPELKAVEEEYGQDRLLVVQGDAGKVGDNQSVVQRTVEKWGAVDGIVMNAGNMNLCRIADLPLEETPDYVNTNLISLLYLIKPALPHLRKSRLGAESTAASNITGRVILVSSGASAKGYAAWGLYSMVKAGMNSLARTLAAEEKESGVLVYAIRPGVVDTGVGNAQMQTLLREQGHGVMDPADMTKFMSAFEGGKLLPPDQPGSVIAGLAAVGGPAELSGEYVDWEDERFASLRLQ